MNNEESSIKSPVGVQEPIDLNQDLAALDSAQREARRQTLLGMLNASTNRRNAARRHKRPSMAIGERVAITDGELCGQSGVVVDADFIRDRAQLEITGIDDPVWVPFTILGGYDV